MERFGDYVLDRPSSAAEGVLCQDTALWSSAHASYVRRNANEGAWRSENQMPLSWKIKHENCDLELKLTDFGHVGVFPEHSGNWDWMTRQLKNNDETLKVLKIDSRHEEFAGFLYGGYPALIPAQKRVAADKRTEWFA